MGVMQVEVNGRAIYEALVKNGMEHIRENYFNIDFTSNKPYGACAIGMMAYNLGVAADLNYEKNEGFNLTERLDSWAVPEGSKWFFRGINGVGSTIINWNDKWDGLNGRYSLSWEQVVQMAHDVLEPYFNETIIVDTWVFG